MKSERKPHYQSSLLNFSRTADDGFLTALFGVILGVITHAAPPLGLHLENLYSFRQYQLAVHTFLGDIANHAVSGIKLLEFLERANTSVTDVVVAEVAESYDRFTCQNGGDVSREVYIG